MRDTNDLYKRLFADPGHIKESRLIIAGEIYDESKIVLSSLITTEQLFAADKLSIGGAVAREISFSAFLSDSVPKRAKIIHEVRLRLGDEVSEWMQKGEYYISTRRRDRVTGLTEVHGYDSMLTSEQAWKPADTDIFPMPMKEAVEKTAAILKIPLDPRNVFKTGDAYKVDYPVADGTASEDQQVAGLTIRQVWRWVAAAMGGNFIINDLGQLRLVPVSDVTATGYLADENGRAITFGENAILVRTAAAAADSEALSALGLNMAEASGAPPLDPITRVILKISGDTGYVSESDTEGLTLEVSCAYGSKTIADDLLAQLQGYVYQPLQAEDALIDPAAELGDPIEVNGLYTILAQKTTTWDALAAADIGAPGEDELEDEYGFTSTPDSEYRYELAQARSLISKTNDRISMEIYGEDGKGGLNGRMNTFTMGLSGISGQIRGYQETLDGYSKQLADYKLDLDGFSADLEQYSEDVNGYKKETASYKLAVDRFETRVGTYQEQAQKTQEAYSTISQKVDNIAIKIVNPDGTETSVKLSDGKVDLKGLVTFSSLSSAPGNGVTKINGGWIDADTLTVTNANISGRLTFSKLPTDVASKSDIENTAAGAAETYIDEWLVSAPTIEGLTVAGGMFTDYDQEYFLYLDKTYDNETFAMVLEDDAGEIFTVLSNRSDNESSIALRGYTILVFDGGTFYAQGDWDFSNANVIWE